MQEQAPTKDLAKYVPDAVAGELNTIKALVTDARFVAAVKQLAPRHLPAERLVRMVIAAASRNPRLLDCTQGSLLKSAIEASILGLDCSGLLGRGYLVPYKNGGLSRDAGRDVYEAQFQAGYLGLCDLARRSGEITSVRAKAVFDGDEFSYEEGLQPSLTHKPSLDSDIIHERKTLRYVYAIAWHKDGGQPDFVVMTFAEVERHRKISKAADGTFWTKHYVAMALKTVARQLCKWLPQSPELSEQLQREYETEADPYPTIGVDALENKDRTGDLVNRLETNGKDANPPKTTPKTKADAKQPAAEQGPPPEEHIELDVENAPAASAPKVTAEHIERRVKAIYAARKGLRNVVVTSIFGAKAVKECSLTDLGRADAILTEFIRALGEDEKPDDAKMLAAAIARAAAVVDADQDDAA